MPSPANYRDLSCSGTLLWVREGLDWGGCEDQLIAGGVDYLEENSIPFDDGGRGGVRAIQFPHHQGIWRRNLHGGMLGNLLGARFPSTDRLTEEVYLSEALRANQVNTPQILLAYAKRHAGIWYQHLISEKLADSCTVFAARENPAALSAARTLLDDLFKLGFWAPDLHPGNLLWQESSQQVWLIDLADACLLGRPLTIVESKARLARYRRYFRKHGGEVPADA